MTDRIHPLKAYRQRHGLTQKDAAVHFGVSLPMICAIELGLKRPSVPAMCERFELGSNGELTRFMLREDIFAAPIKTRSEKAA